MIGGPPMTTLLELLGQAAPGGADSAEVYRCPATPSDHYWEAQRDTARDHLEAAALCDLEGAAARGGGLTDASAYGVPSPPVLAPPPIPPPPPLPPCPAAPPFAVGAPQGEGIWIGAAVASGGNFLSPPDLGGAFGGTASGLHDPCAGCADSASQCPAPQVTSPRGPHWPRHCTRCDAPGRRCGVRPSAQGCLPTSGAFAQCPAPRAAGA